MEDANVGNTMNYLHIFISIALTAFCALIEHFAFVNRPFPSSVVPLFQSESKCETILTEMTLI